MYEPPHSRSRFFRRTAVAAALVVSAGLAAACGSDDADQQAADPVAKVTFALKFPPAAPAVNLVASDKLGFFREERAR